MHKQALWFHRKSDSRGNLHAISLHDLLPLLCQSLSTQTHVSGVAQCKDHNRDKFLTALSHKQKQILRGQKYQPAYPPRRGELIFWEWAAGCQQVKRGVVLAADFTQCPWSRAETDGPGMDGGLTRQEPGLEWGRDVAGRGGQIWCYSSWPAGAGAGVRVGAGAPARVRVSDTRVSGSLGPGMWRPGCHRPGQISEIKSRAHYPEKWENSIWGILCESEYSG